MDITKPKKNFWPFVWRSILSILIAVLLCVGIKKIWFQSNSPFYMVLYYPYVISFFLLILFACLLYHYFLFNYIKADKKAQKKITFKAKILSLFCLSLVWILVASISFKFNLDISQNENMDSNDANLTSAMKMENYFSIAIDYTSENQLLHCGRGKLIANEFWQSFHLSDGSYISLQLKSLESNNSFMSKTLFSFGGGFVPTGMPPEEFFEISDDETSGPYEHLNKIELGYFFTDEQKIHFVCQESGCYLEIELSWNNNSNIILREDLKEQCMKQFDLLKNSVKA